MVDADQVRLGSTENEPKLKDSHLLDELQHVVEGDMAGDRDEVEDLMGGGNGEAGDVGSGR